MCSYLRYFSKYASIAFLLLAIVLISVFGLTSRNAVAQTTQELQNAGSDQEYLISKVRVRGNKVFTNDQIHARLRTKANRRFLRIPGFTWWYWLYQLGDTRLFSGRIGDALKSTGEPPAYLDPIVLDQDIERLRLLYQQAGYRDARVVTSVDTLSQRRLEVIFSIDPGEPTHIRYVDFNISSLDNAQKADSHKWFLVKR